MVEPKDPLDLPRIACLDTSCTYHPYHHIELRKGSVLKLELLMYCFPLQSLEKKYICDDCNKVALMAAIVQWYQRVKNKGLT